ncbi:MAG: cytochrome P450, partial [Chloroflexi bacterium]|nr:cytochrome P450 [Chloroflexota bacterium]
MNAERRIPQISMLRALRFALRQDLIGLMRCHETDSDVFGWRVGLRRYAVVRSPALIEHILVGGYDTYPKSEQYELLKTVLGVGLFTDEGESWARHRRMIQPLMSRRNLTGLVQLMVPPIDAFARRLDALDEGAEVDISPAMIELTLEVVGRSLMGAGFGAVADEIRPAVVEGVESGVYAAQLQVAVGAGRRLVGLAARILHDVPMPVRRLRNIQWMMRTIDRVIEDLIRDHEEHPEAGAGDLVSLLLEARDDDGLPMPRRRIRDELATFMLAGHETTANGLAFMWHLLAEHPAARDRMLTEVDEVLG